LSDKIVGMAKSIEANSDDIRNHKALTQAMGLLDLDVVKQEWDEAEEILFLFCTPRWGVDVCPECGHLTGRIHDYPEQRHIHDLPVRGAKTMLVFDVHRLRCEHCRHVFTLRIRDVVADCTYSKRLAREISDPTRKQDVETLSRLYRIGYKTVESILLKASEAKIAERQNAPLLVKQLGIDEQSNRKGQGNYILVITDLERRIVLDVLADRQKATLIEWLEKPPAGIDLSQLEAAATDLWGHYRDAVSAVFGDKVKIVADRFHVMQNLHKAIHATRREAQQQASNEEERKQLKGLRYILLKKDEKLTESEKQRLDELKECHPQLYQLTRLRQQLYQWYEADYLVEEATKELNRWLEEAETIASKSLQVFCQTLRNWQQEIVNFFCIASPAALSKG
jgi:transposase